MYAVCLKQAQFAECRYAECRYAECRGARKEEDEIPAETAKDLKLKVTKRLKTNWTP